MQEAIATIGALLIGFTVGWLSSYYWQRKIVEKNEVWWSHYKNQM